MENGRIAVPSEAGGGIDSKRSGHFGHCEVFTIIDIENGKIKEVSTLNNVSHVQGGCMVPVNLLASHHVDALIVSGIGMRPLMGFNQAGITVYHDSTQPMVGAAVEDLLAGKIKKIEQNQVCGG